jgi:GNAT superfamily N-acetyltransferase
VRIRPATEADVDAVFVLLDAAVAWLAANGREGQWGTQPWSHYPSAVERVRSRAAAGRLFVAETDSPTTGKNPSELLGVIAYEPEPPAYITQLWDAAQPAEPQIYITNFVGSRAPQGRGVGRLLLDHARATARAQGISLLRLDCYAGGDGALARYYEKAGYRPIRDFTTVDPEGRPWPGRLFELRLEDEL